MNGSNTLDDLRVVLAEEPPGVRAPDLDALCRQGRRQRRRRTGARSVVGVAAAVGLVALAGPLVGVGLPGGERGPASTGTASTEIAERAATTRAAVDGIRSELSAFAGVSPLDASEDSYVLGTPDAENGSGSVPEGDEQWASVLWWRFAFDVSRDADVYVMVDNEPSEPDASPDGDGAGEVQMTCTNVYRDCTERRVPGGRVAIERGDAAEGGAGPGRALRVSFTPADPLRSWILVEVRTRSGEAPFTAQQLVDLVTLPSMSLPEPVDR